jgi:hypothetical protein
MTARPFSSSTPRLFLTVDVRGNFIQRLVPHLQSKESCRFPFPAPTPPRRLSCRDFSLQLISFIGTSFNERNWKFADLFWLARIQHPETSIKRRRPAALRLSASVVGLTRPRLRLRQCWRQIARGAACGRRQAFRRAGRDRLASIPLQDGSGALSDHGRLTARIGRPFRIMKVASSVRTCAGFARRRNGLVEFHLPTRTDVEMNQRRTREESSHESKWRAMRDAGAISFPDTSACASPCTRRLLLCSRPWIG